MSVTGCVLNLDEACHAILNTDQGLQYNREPINLVSLAEYPILWNVVCVLALRWVNKLAVDPLVPVQVSTYTWPGVALLELH